MVESGLPYDCDFAIAVNDIHNGYTPHPRHTGWFRHNDEMLAKMQEHVRWTPGCRAISVFLAGTGFGGADYELIELDGPEYCAWTWFRPSDEAPTGGPTPTGPDLVAALAAMRFQNPRPRRIQEPDDHRGRYKTLLIATASDGEWLIRRSLVTDAPTDDAFDSVAVATFIGARVARHLQGGRDYDPRSEPPIRFT
jgi:hypothetical protein